MRPDEDALHEIAKLATEGKLHIDVGKNLPLSQVVEAQTLQYSKDVCGKVVLDII
jgi:NADPH:quinone reductase-like Zn-dependent oxidoreductase